MGEFAREKCLRIYNLDRIIKLYKVKFNKEASDLFVDRKQL